MAGEDGLEGLLSEWHKKNDVGPHRRLKSTPLVPFVFPIRVEHPCVWVNADTREEYNEYIGKGCVNRRSVYIYIYIFIYFFFPIRALFSYEICSCAGDTIHVAHR